MGECYSIYLYSEENNLIDKIVFKNIKIGIGILINIMN